MTIKNFLKVGIIQKPHGLKGEFKIFPLTDNIKRFKRLNSIYLFIDNSFSYEEIESVKNANHSVIIKLKKYNKIEEIENFRNQYIYIKKEDGERLNKDEYYTDDLVGCSVYYKDIDIGLISEVINNGSCDIFVIKDKNKNKEVYYPFLKIYMEKIDITNKCITINQFEGFFD